MIQIEGWSGNTSLFFLTCLNSTMVWFKYNIDIHKLVHLKSLNSTMVWFKYFSFNLQMIWSNSSQFHYGMIQIHAIITVKMINDEVSIPLWYDSNDRDFLNLHWALLSLNSTMVWFKSSEFAPFWYENKKSQFHYGMIQISELAKKKKVSRQVSIPLWYDSNKKKIQNDITAAERLNSTMVWFKYENWQHWICICSVSIPLWYDSNQNIRRAE